MKNFKDWAGGTIVSIGNKLGITKATVTKAVGAMFIAGLAVQINGPIIAEKDPSVGVNGLSFEQVKSMLGEESKVLSEKYGSDRKIFVFNNDENLAKIVQNFDNRMFDKYTSEAILTTLNKNVYSFVRDIAGLDISNEDINKQAFYEDMNSVEKSGFAVNIELNEKTPDGQPLSVVFVKKDNAEIVNLDSGFESRFPYVIDRADQNNYVFFHEMTHGLDDEEGKPNKALMSLQKEATADVGYALIAIRETGNMDNYINVVRPFRLSNAKDVEHMGVDITDAVMADIEEKDVLGKSDVELMKFAQTLVNTTTGVMFDNTHKNSAGRSFNDMTFMANRNVAYAVDAADKAGYSKAMANLDSMTEGAGKETVMDFSRKAMESSIQNLLYNGVFDEYESSFIKGVEHHVKLWGDDLAKESLAKASESGKFDVKLFAENMGFDVDDSSPSRKMANVITMDSYYQAVLSVEPKSQLVMTQVEPHGVEHAHVPTVKPRLGLGVGELGR